MGGIVLSGVGIWALFQVFGGQALQRLGLIAVSSS